MAWKFHGLLQLETFRVLGKSPELCGDCAFPQNSHTKNLDEITVLFSVKTKPDNCKI